MTVDEFATLVEDMRVKQKKYFKERSHVMLVQSKLAEKKVDDALIVYRHKNPKQSPAVQQGSLLWASNLTQVKNSNWNFQYKTDMKTFIGFVLVLLLAGWHIYRGFCEDDLFTVGMHFFSAAICIALITLVFLNTKQPEE